MGSQLIDKFSVLHKGGAVLWSKEICKLKGNPINDLVRTILLEVRQHSAGLTAQGSWTKDFTANHQFL
jgi:hypothetical protein